MRVVKAFVDSDKVVAAVCRGPLLLVQADAVEGDWMTSFKSIRKDVENAGAEWVEGQAVVDGRFVTSRNPDDLPAFVAAIAQQIETTGADRSRNKVAVGEPAAGSPPFWIPSDR